MQPGSRSSTFLQERLFDPLGMSDTGFSVPEASLDRLATAYATDFKTWETVVYDAAEGGEWARPPAFPSGAAGLVSTVDDYLAFGRMLLDQGRFDGGRILSRPSVAAMTTDQLTPAQKAASGFVPGLSEHDGWGSACRLRPPRTDVWPSPGRFGWNGGLGTSWYSDPAEQMVTILMTQRAWASPRPPTCASTSGRRRTGRSTTEEGFPPRFPEAGSLQRV